MIGRVFQSQGTRPGSVPFRTMVDADLELEDAADELEAGETLRVEEGYYFHRSGAVILLPSWYVQR